MDSRGVRQVIRSDLDSPVGVALVAVAVNEGNDPGQADN